jgi:hypothetical protein
VFHETVLRKTSVHSFTKIGKKKYRSHCDRSRKEGSRDRQGLHIRRSIFTPWIRLKRRENNAVVVLLLFLLLRDDIQRLPLPASGLGSGTEQLPITEERFWLPVPSVDLQIHVAWYPQGLLLGSLMMQNLCNLPHRPQNTHTHACRDQNLPLQSAWDFPASLPISWTDVRPVAARQKTKTRLSFYSGQPWLLQREQLPFSDLPLATFCDL